MYMHCFFFLFQAYLNNLHFWYCSRVLVLFSYFQFQKLKFFGITSMLDAVNVKNIETATKHY